MISVPLNIMDISLVDAFCFNRLIAYSAQSYKFIGDSIFSVFSSISDSLMISFIKNRSLSLSRSIMPPYFLISSTFTSRPFSKSSPKPFMVVNGVFNSCETLAEKSRLTASALTVSVTSTSRIIVPLIFSALFI